MKNKKIINFLFQMLSLFLITSGSAFSFVEIQNDFVRTELKKYWEQLDDPSNAIKFEQVLESTSEMQFSELNGNLNRGYTSKATWIRFELKNLAGEEKKVILRINPQMLDYVDVHMQMHGSPTIGTNYKQFAIGDHRPSTRDDRPYAIMALPVTISSQESKWIYIHLHTTSSHLLSADLLSPEAYVEESTDKLMLITAYQATALVVALITFLLAVRTKDLTHGLYGLLPLGLCMNNIGTEGTLTLLAPSVSYLLNDWVVGLGNFFCFGGISLFAMALFNTSKYHPLGHRYLQLILVLSGIAFLGSGTHGYSYFIAATQVVSLGLWVFLFKAAIALSKRESRFVGHLFVITFAIPLFAASLSLIKYLGLLPHSDFNQYVLPVTSLIHMLLMNLALSERLLVAEANFRDAAQAAEFEAQNRKEQENMLAMLTHEIRTPVAVIDAATQSLEALEVNYDKVRHERFDRIRRSSNRLGLMLDLASASYATTALGGGYSFTVLNISALTTEIIGLLNEVEQKKISVINNTEESEILGDIRRLRFALLNLMDNACKYSTESGSIRITISDSEQNGKAGIQWKIEDDGPGIPLSSQAKIFEKFHRGGEYQNKPGLGLGLFISKSIIENHEGTLSLATAERGACFICWLPRKLLGV